MEPLTTQEPQGDRHDAAAEEVFVFPVTVAQRRFWMLDQLKPGNPALNFPLSARLQGHIDPAVLENTMNEIIRRHEILRTSFRTMDGELMQVIHPDRRIKLDRYDVSAVPEPLREAEVEKLRLEEAVHAFSLTNDALLRAGLIKVRENDYVLLLSMHHIACDGMSNGVLIPEVAKIYSALVTGEAMPPDPPLQYADFAQWQNDWLSSLEAARQRDYWLARLKGTLPTLNLPTDRPRRAGRSHGGTINSLLLPKSLSEPLKELCRREDATFFMLILAVYGLLLYRYTGNSDIIIGSPAANRNQTDLEGLIGLFTNPLLMRMDFSGNPTLLDLLARVKQISLEAFANQSYPFEKLAEELHTDPHRAGVQWLQAYFVFQKAFMLPQQMAGATLIPLRSLSPGAMFEWLLGVVERAEGVRLQPEYNTDLYDSATIDRMLHHFRRALETFLANPQTRVDHVDILTPAERQELLDWRASRLELPENQNVIQLFEQQVRNFPVAPAWESGPTRLSYAQLNQKAAQLARYLRDAQTKSGDRIALAVDLRSSWFVIGFLAILKVGACCVLLDPARSDFCQNLRASSPALLLTSDAKLPGGPNLSAYRVVNLEAEAAAICQKTGLENLGTQPEHPACIHFSSGRSCPAKGLVFNHQALASAAQVAASEWGIDAGDRIVSADILPALVSGACLVSSPDFSGEPRAWSRWMRDNNITVAELSTPLWHEIVRQCQEKENLSALPLRTMIVGGENISPVAIKAWKTRTCGRIRLLNSYQVAEAAGSLAYTDSLALAENAFGRITISKPAPNVSLFILDANLQPVPAGVPGDIYFGCDTAATSYFENGGFHAAQLPPAPAGINLSLKLLKIGDRGRFVANQGIELTGRIDDLSRTHGYRLELWELRQILFQHPAIWDVIIETRNDSDKSVLAHVVTVPGVVLESTDVLQFVREHLPPYMIPASAVVWKQFPLGPEGLVDRKALAACPVQSENTRNGVARTSTETALVGIWKDVLNSRRVGIHDNFFELGGDSLAAATLQARIEKEFGRRLPLATYFQAPTIEQQAALLSQPTSEPLSRVFTFQPGKTGTPLFLFHYLSSSQKLAAHFPSHRPVHAIDSPFDEEFRIWEQTGQVKLTMEELARRCVADVRQIQPEGPYNFAGFCYGGVVAFAVARELAALGQRVSFLGMLDAFYKPGIKPVRFPALRRWAFHANKTLAQGPKYLVRKIKKRRQLVEQRRKEATTPQSSKPKTTEAELNHVRRIEFMRHLIEAFRSSVYTGPVMVFRAVADPRPFDFDFGRNGWQEIVSGEISLEDFECSHLDLSEEPYVRELADRIERYLRRA